MIIVSSLIPVRLLIGYPRLGTICYILKFNVHINVEVRSKIQCMKYLFEHCYKGHDCAFIKIQSANVQFNENNNDRNHLEDENNDDHNYVELK